MSDVCIVDLLYFQIVKNITIFCCIESIFKYVYKYINHMQDENIATVIPENVKISYESYIYKPTERLKYRRIFWKSLKTWFRINLITTAICFVLILATTRWSAPDELMYRLSVFGAGAGAGAGAGEYIFQIIIFF